MSKADIYKADLLVFLILLGFGLTTALLSIYLNNLGISLAQIGLIFALGAIATGIIRIPIGTVVDKFGKKKFILLGAIGYPIFAAGVALSQNATEFIILQIFIGLFGAIFWTAFSSHFFDIMSKGNEGMELGGRNTIIYATSAFAPILAALFANNFGFKVLFFISALIGVAAVAAAVTIKDKYKNNSPKFSLRDIEKEYSDIFKVKGYKTILFGTSIVALTFALWVIFLPIWLQEQGLSLEAIGTLLSVNAIIGAILQVPLGKIIDKYPAKMLVVPAMLFMWLGGILFFTFKNYLSYIINRTFFGVASDFAYWPLVGMLAKTTPRKEHGVAVASVSAAEAIVYGLTALIGGWLTSIYGIEKVLFWVLFISLAAALILVFSKTLQEKGRLFYRRHHLHVAYKQHSSHK